MAGEQVCFEITWFEMLREKVSLKGIASSFRNELEWRILFNVFCNGLQAGVDSMEIIVSTMTAFAGA
ncbi:MAG: hypothetical protein ACU84Q_17725 [Gammaproteobacteria bacterium]